MKIGSGGRPAPGDPPAIRAEQKKKQDALTCPKCRRVAYVVCTNRECQCWRSIPKGKKPLRWTKDGEGQRCAYCGFTAHADYWFERDLTLAAKRDFPLEMGSQP